MYRTSLSNQWKNLYSDFSQEYDQMISRQSAPESLNHWYATRIHRWKSLAYAEGIALDQLGNQDFAKTLQKTMVDFRFRQVESRKPRPAWMALGAGVTAGVVVGVVLKLLHWSSVKSVISGIVVCAAVGVSMLKIEETARKNEEKRVKEDYVGQVSAHLEKLLAVCDQFHIE